MRLKILYITCCSVILAACGAVLSVEWLAPKLSSVDGAERAAVAFVLRHTPLRRIEQVQWYTGGPLEISVLGVTYTGQQAYAFVQHGAATIAYADQVIPKQRAILATETLSLPISSVVSAVPGRIDPGYHTVFGRRAGGKGAVWEITARLKGGAFLFSYVDMYTGRLLWHFTTNAQFRPWQQ